MKAKVITRDVYDISSRIKKIDRDYTVVYDYDKHAYLALYKGQMVKTLGGRLDKACLNDMYRSHVRNSKKIFLDMENTNKRLTEKSESEAIRKSKQTLSDFLSYADKKGSDVDFSLVNTTRWI